MIAQASTIRTSSSSRHLVGALNTRKIGKKIRITLRKSKDGGFGIKIAERDNMYGMSKPIFITAIATNGSAYRDGRLREGDMLLEVNGIDLSGKSQSDVAKMLKGVSVKEDVEFVVSRQQDIQDGSVNDDQENISNQNNDADNTNNNCDNDTSLIDLDVPDQDDSVFNETSDLKFEKKVDKILDVSSIDGPGIYVYDILLNDAKTAGLGLYLKYPRRSTDRKDLGIWIEKVITGGAAYKDGRLQPHDQILAINGINLIGLSNNEATETLTAAVCRGVGPEAIPNTVRLNIHRRDPAVVAKILHGTNSRDSTVPLNKNRVISNRKQQKSNSRAEYLNLPMPGHRDYDSPSFDKNENSKDSYQTAFENTIQNRSNLVADTSSTSGSTNNNSHNDSALSPQTQASNSLKMSNSCNDKLDQSNSDKTNDTSSAISQITDYTNLPTNLSPEKSSNDSENHNATTLPKSLQIDEDVGQNIEQASTQSWDDDSIDAVAASGEEHFQRDGFGRQSISEKRHAQLMAKNTDTYRRNKQQREEREMQRHLEEQLARQHLDDSGNRRSIHLPIASDHKLPISYTTNEFKSIYGLHSQPTFDNELQHDDQGISYHREVPVDVYPVPVEPQRTKINGLTQRKSNSGNQKNLRTQYDFIDEQARISNSQMVPNISHQQIINDHAIVQHYNECFKCGSIGPCGCDLSQIPIRSEPYATNPRYDQMLKRSNSLESIQQHQIRDNLVVPRSGTVRVARNRKVNESFRVAVDRSYDTNVLDDSSSRQNQSCQSDYQHRFVVNGKNPSSIANSTLTTNSNDEKKHLIKNSSANGSNTNQKKSSSLLTKFLKFGSIKRSKKKNRDQSTSNPKTTTKTATETKPASRDISSRESDTTRSQLSSGSHHSRTQSSQSHPNLNNQYNNAHLKHDALNGHTYQQNLKQGILHSNHQLRANGFDIYSQRTSMQGPICQPYQTVYNNTQQQRNHHQMPMANAKFSQNTSNRPVTNHHIMNEQQYSQVQLHHQHQTSQPMAPIPPHVAHTQHLMNHNPHIMPATSHIHNHYPYATASHNRNHVYPGTPQVSLTNGNCHQSLMQAPQPPPPNQWQSPIHQAPNGLWVANSPVSSSETNHLFHNGNIHGTMPQRNMINMMQQHRPVPQAPIPLGQSGPFISPPYNGPISNGMVSPNHGSTLEQSCPYTLTQQQQQQHLHNQPQHIYYYDF